MKGKAKKGNSKDINRTVCSPNAVPLLLLYNKKLWKGKLKFEYLRIYAEQIS